MISPLVVRIIAGVLFVVILAALIARRKSRAV